MLARVFVWLGCKRDQELMQIKPSNLCVYVCDQVGFSPDQFLRLAEPWPTGGEEGAGWTVSFVGSTNLASNQRMWSCDKAQLI